jgi:RNA binding exosome subunit
MEKQIKKFSWFQMSQRNPKPEFASVTISFFIHSTEDESRLLNQASNSFGIPLNQIELESLEGHYVNRLRSAKIHVTGKDANLVSESILSKLNSQSKKIILDELEKSVDEHDSLYLRLDRQLLGETLVLGSEEPIRIKLKPKNRYGNRRAIHNAYRKLLET